MSFSFFVCTFFSPFFYTHTQTHIFPEAVHVAKFFFYLHPRNTYYIIYWIKVSYIFQETICVRIYSPKMCKFRDRKEEEKKGVKNKFIVRVNVKRFRKQKSFLGCLTLYLYSVSILIPKSSMDQDGSVKMTRGSLCVSAR